MLLLYILFNLETNLFFLNYGSLNIQHSNTFKWIPFADIFTSEEEIRTHFVHWNKFWQAYT